MSELDRLMDAIRTQALRVVVRGREAIEAGVPIDHIMDHYLSRAFDLEAEADAQAIVASGRDPASLSAVEDCLEQLDALLTEFDAEFPAQE